MFLRDNIDIKKTQRVLLNLLNILDKICRENNLEYWIDGGTLLGAMRNKKIIPWDDDVDICLLSDDYHKLLKILNSKKDLGKNIFIFNNYRPFQHWSSYLADSSMLKSQNLPYKIDILNMKSVPNTKAALENDKSMINFAAYFFRGKFKYDNINKAEYESLFLKDRSVFTQRSSYVAYLNQYVKELNKKDKSHLYSYPFNDIYVKKEREYYTYDNIFPLKEIEFEGMKIMAPNNPEHYLTKLYGSDYLTPPSIDKQHPASSKMVTKKVPNFVIKANIYIVYLLKEIKYVIKRILIKK